MNELKKYEELKNKLHVPPCNSCFLYHMSCHEDKKEQQGN